MTKLDLTKPVQTREGDPVRIICTDRKGEYPIVGLVLSDHGDGHEVVRAWPIDGQFYSKNMQHLDLINVPPKPVKCYTHVYLVGTSLIAGDIRVDDGPRKSPAQGIGWKFIKTIEFEI